MQKPEYVLENETHKILLACQIQIDCEILARRAEIVLITKKKKRAWRLIDFVIPADHTVKLKETG